jgi:hypothetical protein
VCTTKISNAVQATPTICALLQQSNLVLIQTDKANNVCGVWCVPAMLYQLMDTYYEAIDHANVIHTYTNTHARRCEVKTDNDNHNNMLPEPKNQQSQ